MNNVGLTKIETIQEFTKAIQQCMHQHQCTKVQYKMYKRYANQNFVQHRTGTIQNNQFLKSKKLPHFMRKNIGAMLLCTPYVEITPA